MYNFDSFSTTTKNAHFILKAEIERKKPHYFHSGHITFQNRNEQREDL